MRIEIEMKHFSSWIMYHIIELEVSIVRRRYTNKIKIILNDGVKNFIEKFLKDDYVWKI